MSEATITMKDYMSEYYENMKYGNNVEIDLDKIREEEEKEKSPKRRGRKDQDTAFSQYWEQKVMLNPSTLDSQAQRQGGKESTKLFLRDKKKSAAPRPIPPLQFNINSRNKDMQN